VRLLLAARKHCRGFARQSTISEPEEPFCCRSCPRWRRLRFPDLLIALVRESHKNSHVFCWQRYVLFLFKTVDVRCVSATSKASFAGKNVALPRSNVCLSQSKLCLSRACCLSRSKLYLSRSKLCLSQSNFVCPKQLCLSQSKLCLSKANFVCPKQTLFRHEANFVRHEVMLLP